MVGALEKTLNKSVDKINRKLPYLSKSQYKRLYSEACTLYELLCDLEYDKEIYFNNRFRIKDNYLEDTFDLIADPMYDLSEEVIDLYKKNDYYFYGRRYDKKIKNRSKIIDSFLEYFMPKMIDQLNNMVKNNHVLIMDTFGGNYGAYYSLNKINESYIVLDTETYKNDLDYIFTVVHELMHHYAVEFLKNYIDEATEKLNEGFLVETITLYSELSLHNFLTKEKLLDSDIEINKNNLFYNYLTQYKMIKYLTEASDKNIPLDFDGNTFYVSEDLKLEGEYPFDYPYDFFSNINLAGYIYGLSNIYSYELYGKELSGDKIVKVVNDFLIEIANDSYYDKLLNHDYNLDLMEKDIKEHNEKMKKMYKIK